MEATSRRINRLFCGEVESSALRFVGQGDACIARRMFVMDVLVLRIVSFKDRNSTSKAIRYAR
jgi:hypothetical protein